MNSPITILCEYLEASGTELYDLVNVSGIPYVGRLRAAQGWVNDTPAVIVQPQAATSEVHAPVITDRVAIKCYGGSSDPKDAEDVFEAVYSILHGISAESTSTGGIVLAFLEVVSFMIEPDTNWPVYVATFRVSTTYSIGD